MTEIRTEFDRIKGNVEDSLSAVAEKGVSVPAGSNSDTLAGLIRSIEAGGGTDTSDATATTNDIISGKTAYGANGKITGGINLVSRRFEVEARPVWQSGVVQTSFSLSPRTAFEDGTTIRFLLDGSYFGNATAADVAKGKTFTSASGLKVAGAYEAKSETCMVTVEIPEGTPVKYMKDGYAGLSYIDPQGVLCIQGVTGVPSGMTGVTSYTFDTVECKCGSMLSVSLGMYGITGFTKSSDEISDPVMTSASNRNTMASFMLPETPGEYTIQVYY